MNKNFKKIKTQFKLLQILSLLLIFCIFGVGFSSWAILDKQQVNLNIKTGDLFSVSNIVSIQNNINNINYCKEGFINDGLIENKTSIYVNLEFKNLIEARKHLVLLSKNNTLNLNINLKETSNVNFIGSYSDSLLVTLSNSNLTLSNVDQVNHSSYGSNIKISNISETIDTFSLYLIFNFKVNTSNFENEIYPFLKNQKIDFSLELNIEYE